jgi:Xaa-Pro dipeptidase
VIQKRELEAVLLIGDVNNGQHYFGDLRYFGNNKIICNRQVIIVFKDLQALVLASSLIQTHANERRAFIKDCRYTEDLLGDAVRLLKERGLTLGKIGTSYEILPAAWYITLGKELPGISWVDIHDDILNMRHIRSTEEVEALKISAQLCDAGFEAAAKLIKPGVTESEVAAEIEYAARKGGAEDHFTLIGSGRFSFQADKNSLYLPYDPPAKARKLEHGDSVVMEITPRYDGYWTQLVRAVNVGEENSDLAVIQKVCVDAIKEGTKGLKTGNTISDVVTVMDQYVKENGFLMVPPLGHVCGVDMIDGRVSPANTRILTPGQTVIIHPTLSTLDGSVRFFWGETYLVTETGPENMMKASEELLTV